jgi:RNA polymerase sigma-70 factor (family 1)
MRKKNRKIFKKNLEEKQQEEYFQEVYKAYFDRLFGYALIITRSENIAKDAVSEVFFNLWNAQTDLHSIKELKSYLFTSVKNQSIKALSNDPVGFRIDCYEHIISSVDKIDPEELLVGKELEQFLNDAIENLPDHCALVFRMVREDGMKYDEVANELGISKDTVKYHVKTALKKLTAELEGYFTETQVLKWVSAGSISFFLLNMFLSFL